MSLDEHTTSEWNLNPTLTFRLPQTQESLKQELAITLYFLPISVFRFFSKRSKDGTCVCSARYKNVNYRRNSTCKKVFIHWSKTLFLLLVNRCCKVIKRSMGNCRGSLVGSMIDPEISHLN